MAEHKTHKAHAGSGEWELLYRRPYQGKGVESESAEFIIRIDDPPLLDEWKINPSSLAVVEFVSAPEVYVTEHSHTGKLRRPSNEQLLDTFNSHNFEDILIFMAEHGHLQPAGQHAGLKAHDKAVFKGNQQQEL